MAKQQNKSKILTKKSNLAIGEIRFYDDIEPPLKAGEYSLSATQDVAVSVNSGTNKVVGETEIENPDATYVAPQKFIVQGPQFKLNPDAIHSRYPAPLAVGDFSKSLPNIVLTEFSFPWTRPIDPHAESMYENTPWVGLLTIHPDEITKGGKTITTTNKVLGPKTVTISELVTKQSDKILAPDLDSATIAEDLNTPITVVDIDFQYFQTIAPTLEELEYLAHGREVNTGGKVILGMEGDGFFSLVIGNRLPKAAEEGKPPVDNHVFLVSFEGYSQYLRGGKDVGKVPKDSVIRLVLLDNWIVKGAAAHASFIVTMKELCSKGNGGVNLMQMPGNIEGITDETAKKALTIGYTALQNDMRVGEQATSWYRGPLVPTPTARGLGGNFDFGTYLYGDHAIHYDPSTGIFDHSYSAAWQIGRLLALSDASFARALFQWRNIYVRKYIQASAEKNTKKNIATIAGEDQSAPGALDSLPNSMKYMLARQLRNTDWPLFKSREEKTLGDELPGVLSDKDKDQIRKKDEDPLIAIVNKTNE